MEYTHLFPAISRSFSFLESCLIAYSRRIAACLSANSSKYTSVTGVRLRVYLAPFPWLWARRRFLRSVVHPV